MAKHTGEKKLENRIYLNDLPQELLAYIAERLDNHLDFNRFRAVCKSFRFSVHPFQSDSYHHIKLPLINFNSSEFNPGFITVRQQIFYLYQHPPSASGSSSPSSHPGWLLKVPEYPHSKNRFLMPLLPRGRAPLMVNVLDSFMTELHKHYLASSYDFPCEQTDKRFIVKLVVIPSYDEFSAAMAIYDDHTKLAWIKHGDKRWTAIDDQVLDYDDIIIYKGQFYAVHKTGKLLKINASTSAATEVVSEVLSLENGGCDGGCLQKSLVESGGELLLVGRYALNKWKVYKLDEEKGKWVAINSLGGRAVVVKRWRWAFSVPGVLYRPNRIYFKRSGINSVGLRYDEVCLA